MDPPQSGIDPPQKSRTRGMNLAEWAYKHDIPFKTAYYLFRSGKFPRPVEKLPSGQIVVYEKELIRGPPSAAALYAHVPAGMGDYLSHNPKLRTQMQQLRYFAAAKGLPVRREVWEVGEGPDCHREGLEGILADPYIKTIVVERRENLAPFGTEYIESALKASGRELMVMNETRNMDEEAKDMANVLTCIYKDIYGETVAKERARRALKAIEYGQSTTTDLNR